MNNNQLIVLNELKENFNSEFVFDDVAYFADYYKFENTNNGISNAYKSLTKKEEIEVLESYLWYLKYERTNL